MIRYIGLYSSNKAKRDIDEILHSTGAVDSAVRMSEQSKTGRFVRKILCVAKMLFVLKKDDVLLIQYPFKKYYSLLCDIARLKGAKTVTIIHDLGTFRRRKLSESQEIRRLNHTDYIIAHNDRMKQWLEDRGVKCPVGTLDIFDYLSATNHADNGDGKTEFVSVAYAGGLHHRKNAFIYDADSAIAPCRLNLYGPGEIDAEKEKNWQNTRYNGLIDSDKFIETIGDDWGLVWDGDSIDGCTGIWGEYLRLNNPHKTSFYLRAGLPVIVWKESAMAPFITSNGLGIAVDSLRELPAVLKAVGKQEYDGYKRNVAALARKLDDGHFFKKAFNDALSVVLPRAGR